MVRVCNLCLDQIAKVDEDEDDDHHSVASSAITSHFPDMRTFGHGHGRQPSTSSPLISSTLFGRGDEPFSLFSIAESRRHITYGSEDSALNSRPTTPDDDIGPDALGVPVRPAPFRRSAFPEDEKESGVTVVEPDQPPPSESSLSQIRSHVDFPTMIVIPQNTTSSIQFPISSPDQSFGMDGPFSGGLERSRYSSLADIDSLPTPFIRSRVQSRLMDSVSIGEPGWRTRRDSVA
jgi:1-phosphatidylinositol-3-phosphate 5-kinase